MSEFSALQNLKQSLRRNALTQRSQLPVAVLSHAVCSLMAHWEPFKAAWQVLAYYPFRGEIDLRPLMASHPQKAWYLPVVPPSQEMVFYRYEPGLPLREGKFGIAEPPMDGAPFAQGDAHTLILVPGVLFDRQGYRLGYGKGFYDRFLARPETTTCWRVGIVPSVLVADALPHDAWDVPMQALATETEILIP